MGTLDKSLSLLSVSLVIGLAAIFLWRKLNKKYPVFFAYILASILSTVARLSVSAHYETYFKVFWATEAIYAVFALLALHEAFRDVFILDYRDWRWFWMVFPSTVVILSTIFIGNALLHPPAQAPPVVAVILSFGTVANCVKGGVFLLFAILAWLLLGKSWPTYPFGMVLGFAVSALGSVAAYWLRSIFGTKLNTLGKYGPSVAYILAVLIWMGSCFLPPEPGKRWDGFTYPKQGLATMRQYLKALNWIARKR